jgi:hypothetical protein
LEVELELRSALVVEDVVVEHELHIWKVSEI